MSIAAGLMAGALATAVLYAFRKLPGLVRRLAWPVAAMTGGFLFFTSVGIVLKPFFDWGVAMLLASIWALGWLFFLWRPALLAKDTER